MKENKNWKKQIALFLISQNLSILVTLITPAVFLSPLVVVRSFGSEVWKLTAKEIL